MSDSMKRTDLLHSIEYKKASSRIADWKEKLQKSDKPATVKIRDEKMDFFSKMIRKNPELYSIFEIDDKALSELIYTKLSGGSVVLN